MFLGCLNLNATMEFRNSKWRIRYGGSKIKNLLYFYKNEYR